MHQQAVIILIYHLAIQGKEVMTAYLRRSITLVHQINCLTMTVVNSKDRCKTIAS